MKLFTFGSKSSFAFEVSDSPFETKVVNFEVIEKLSHPFEVTVFLASEEDITFNDMIGKEALLTLFSNEADRHFHGIIRKFYHSGNYGRFNLYTATVVPSLWLLSLEEDCRIFQNQKLTSIISTILIDSDITADRFEFRLKNKEIEKKYCVQYRETDLNFISRILAEEGIYYFFEHGRDKHVIVFADDPNAHIPISGQSVVGYNPTASMVAEKECIHSFDYSQRIRSDVFAHTNFNFKQPSVDLESKHQPGESQKRKIYEYPANCGDTERGRFLAKIRLQERTAFKEKAEGSSYCSRFTPGFTYILSDYSVDAFNGEYLLVEVKHFGQQPQSFEENASEGESGYSNSFMCIPYSVTYRPARIEKPYVKGLQSAIVVGPPGEEIYSDKYGRVKVQFHWDREGQRDDKSSCWLRIGQTWSGNGWGMISIPRVGDEVLVDFIDGDPDRPIIVGSVNNAESPALYALPANKTQSGIRTRSYPNGGLDNYHELRFEDKKGSEEIYLQSEKDWNILVKNNKGQTVGNNETLTVKSSRSKSIGGSQNETVGGDSTVSVTGALSETAREITLTAQSKITLVCGGSTIVVEPSGVTITGATINMN